jgi:hypothetical protein
VKGLWDELARVGIRGRLAHRIELELDDHLRCDPSAQLGTPTEIAERFAVELRVVRTRRAAVVTFAALALCAVAVLVAAGRQPVGAANPGAGLAILAFAQIALVAGSLALLRAVLARTSGDLRLAQRRSAIALAAGAGVCAAVAVDSPSTWLLVCALAPLPVLAVAAASTRRAVAVTGAASATKPELPLSGLLVLGAIAVAGVVAQGALFEHSAFEGFVRGSIEAAGLLAAVVLLGRPLGLRR